MSGEVRRQTKEEKCKESIDSCRENIRSIVEEQTDFIMKSWEKANKAHVNIINELYDLEKK